LPPSASSQGRDWLPGRCASETWRVGWPRADLDHRNPGGRSRVYAGMRTRALRPVLIAAALAGAVVGFLLLRSGGDETPPQPQNTIEQALTGFVAERFGVGYVGRCPREFPEDGEVPRGVCSARLSGADGRVVYRVGHPFSEWAGEATFVRDASGSWHVASFEEYPPLGS
jgi:hypothetical protein